MLLAEVLVSGAGFGLQEVPAVTQDGKRLCHALNKT